MGGGTLKSCISAFEKKFKERSGHKWENRLDPTPSSNATTKVKDLLDIAYELLAWG